MAIFLTEKQKHFKEAIKNLQKKMWDTEFMVTKRREEREGFRTEYDRINEMMDAITQRLGEEQKKTDPDKTIVENLQNRSTNTQQDIDQLKLKMNQIDQEIDGYEYTEQGQVVRQQGLLETIDGYRTLIDLVGKHIKTLWAKTKQSSN